MKILDTQAAKSFLQISKNQNNCANQLLKFMGNEELISLNEEKRKKPYL